MFLAATLLLAALQSPPTVPLSRWTDSNWPNGVDFGNSIAVSWGDYDADGWPDLFSYGSGQLWHNESGLTWSLAADLDIYLPQPAGQRYGSSFGDYDADGLPDLACEPRKGFADTCFHLLKNRGGGVFVDVAPSSAIIMPAQPCGLESETAVWGDVDGDGDLDLFLPAYPPAFFSTDNLFFHNLGPTGPGGLYRFLENGFQIGVHAPPNVARPEGAQFLDVDSDGDLDLYSNGTLYRNISALDAPAFEIIEPSASGIKKRTITDEGIFFLDYDLDGDWDLLVCYTAAQGLRLWESRGDSTWFLSDDSVIEDYQSGATFGLSVADWDGDGDLDFQALATFRANQAMESGSKSFLLATHSIPAGDLQGATGSWADWDQDGDLDVAFGLGAKGSALYRNDTWNASSPQDAPRHVRVRVVRDSATVPRGLETEFGAQVEIVVRGDEKRHRKQFASSASGYLTQNEYPLTFQLPTDPAPGDPREDVRFDVTVQFPALPGQGFPRVDKFVNPALGGLDLAGLLANREITVFRSGRIALLDRMLEPIQAPGMTTSTQLITPDPLLGMAEPSPATGGAEFVGIELKTQGRTLPSHLLEIQVDGELAPALTWKGKAANLLLWDVTDPSNPILQEGLATTPNPSNNRQTLACDWTLQPDRTYRLIARVARLRSTAIASPVIHPEFDLTGGLRFSDSKPATGAAVASANLDPSAVWLAVRARSGRGDWGSLGGGTAGSLGTPTLAVQGDPVLGAWITLTASGLAPFSPAVLVGGSNMQPTPGQIMVGPAPEKLHGPWLADAVGMLTLRGTWPAGLKRGEPWFMQVLAADMSTPAGASATNIWAGVTR